MKNFKNTLIVLLIIALIVLLYYVSTRKCFYLPRNSNPEVFGPYFWKSLHSTVENIPCNICKNDAIDMMKFMHDLVNHKLQKPIYDKANMDKWIKYINNIQK